VASEEVIPAGRLMLKLPLVPGSAPSAPLLMLNTRLAGVVLSLSVIFTVALPLVVLPVKVKLVLAPPLSVAITVSVCSMI